MRILFLHHTFPGPFRYLAARLGMLPDTEVVFLSERSRRDVRIPGVRQVTVSGIQPVAVADRTERELMQLLRYGSRFANALLKLRQDGFEPDIVYAHPRWGCSFFVQDVFPEAFHAVYAEWYYTKGSNYTFFTHGAPRPGVEFAQSRIRNLSQLNALAECQLAVTSTKWQRAQYPAPLAERIHVVHEGVDTDFFSPKAGERFRIEGCDLSAAKELVTFSGRGLEPFRGFPQFYRSLPRLLAARPECHVLIMASERQGGDESVSLEGLRREVPVDPRRVHFVGFRPYEEYRRLLRASTVHVYFTAPFALSAGLFESMSCGCLLVSSDTEPVREVVRHGENGFLCDFWDHDMLADMTAELLARAPAMDSVRAAARERILEAYNLKVQIPRHMDVLLSAYADWKRRHPDDAASR